MDRLEEGVGSGWELKTGGPTTEGKVSSVLIANRKGEEKIGKRDISKEKQHILVTYCLWEVEGRGGKFCAFKTECPREWKRGGGASWKMILSIEIGILRGEEVLKEDNLDILRCRGKFRG